MYLLAGIPMSCHIYYLGRRKPETAPPHVPFTGVLGFLGVLVAPIDGRLRIPLLLDAYNWELVAWALRGFKPRFRE